MAEVEVDTRLGRTRVLGLWQGLSAGKIVCPELARSQVYGAMVQGLSAALYEERRLDENAGWLTTASLEDYRIAGLGDIPPMEVVFDEEGFPNVRGGAIGISELAICALTPAIANAVTDATGKRAYEVPLRMDRVLG
jgi:xanthine dehydrogenase YagR molybdenum-binding subunit